MRYNLLLALSVSFFVSAFALAAEKSPEEYWRGTDLQFAELSKKEYVNANNCFANEQHFMGCFHALAAIASQMEPPRVLVPDGHEVEYGDKVAAIEKVQGLALLRLKPDTKEEKTKSLMQFIQEKNAKRDRLQAALSKLYKNSRGGINFPGFLVAFRRLAVRADNEAFVTAQAINAYLKTVNDPHTRLEPTQALLDSRKSTGESFFGVGMTLQEIAGSIIVDEPLEGSPAIQAGVRPGDIVVAANGKPSEGRSLDSVVNDIRGPAGTVVRLDLKRDGQPVVLHITRGPIQVKNVSFKIVRDTGSTYGYIKHNSFMSESGCEEIKQAIFALTKQQASGLILDMRGNPGGLMWQASCIGGLFVGRKLIVTSRPLDKSEEDEPQFSNEAQITTLPLVVLINGGSASASEIVAGAIQDYHRGWLLGDRSYGKGTVQEIDTYTDSTRPPSYGMMSLVSMARTTARFHLPSGRTNQIVSVMPNFLVPARPDATAEELFRAREADLFSNALPPLDKPWTETRPAEAAKMTACMGANGKAKSIYDAHKAANQPRPDYQLLAAQDLLNCAH